MMKKFTLSFLAFFLLAACYQPKRECVDFRTGSFSFDYIVNGVEKTGKFTRDSVYSIEYYDNQIDSATVRWVNDCEFILKDVHNKISIHYKILKTTDSSYTFEYRNASRDPQKKYLVKTGTAYKTN